MWFLFLLTLLNAALDEKGFVLVHRFDIAGLPINVLDGLLGLGCVVATIGFLRSSPSRFQTVRAHPVYIATLVLFALGVAAGVIGGVTNGTPTYVFALFLRNMTAVPLAMFCGYYFYQRPTSAKWFSYIHVIGGICSAGLILVFFVGKSAEGGAVQIDNIRAIQYVSVYAGLAAAFLLFTLLERECRIMWRYWTVKIGSFCLLGQVATMSRSDWLAAVAAMLAIPFLLPKQGRIKKLAIFLAAVALVFGLFLAGTYAGARATGRDLPNLMYKRLLTVLPFERGDDSYLSTKAWDTRLPGVFVELKYWLQSPIIGQGFGYTSTKGIEADSAVGFNHNVWTAALATTGIVGFAAYLLPVLGLIVIGRRLVRDRADKGSVLIGAIGFTAGIYHLIYGAATMSFNAQRGALLLGLIAGVVFRCRMMQLEQKAAMAGYLDDRIDRYE